MTDWTPNPSAWRGSTFRAINMFMLCSATCFAHGSTKGLLPAMTTKIVHKFFKKFIIT